MDNELATKRMTSAIAHTEERAPYLRMALTSGYNIVLLLLCLLAGLASGEWWLLGIGLGLEAAWLGLAPHIPPVRHGFDEVFREERRQQTSAEVLDALRRIGEEERERYGELERLRLAVREHCSANATLAIAVVDGEGDKLDRLLRSFLQIALQVARYERYIDSSDLSAVEGQVERQRTIVARLGEGQDAEALHLAERNLVLLERRLAKAVEIRRKLRLARAQLNLIENTVRLLRDQSMTMDSPDELSEQLGELMASIEVLELSERESEAFFRRLEEGSLPPRSALSKPEGV